MEYEIIEGSSEALTLPLSKLGTPLFPAPSKQHFAAPGSGRLKSLLQITEETYLKAKNGALVTLLILQMRKWRPREVKQLVRGPTVGKRKPCVTDRLHSFIHSSNRHVMKFTV